MIKKLLSVLVVLPFLAFGQSAVLAAVLEKGANPQWENISPTGEHLLSHFWKDRALHDAAHVSRYIDRNFQSVYYFGALNQSGELNLINTLNIIGYSISNTVETRQGSFLIITYLANVDEILNGQHIQGVVPCQTTWQLKGEHWKLMSHAEVYLIQHFA